MLIFFLSHCINFPMHYIRLNDICVTIETEALLYTAILGEI